MGGKDRNEGGSIWIDRTGFNPHMGANRFYGFDNLGKIHSSIMVTTARCAMHRSSLLIVFGQFDARAQFDFVKYLSQRVIADILAFLAHHVAKLMQARTRQAAGQKTMPDLVQAIQHIITALARPTAALIRHLLDGDQRLDLGDGLRCPDLVGTGRLLQFARKATAPRFASLLYAAARGGGSSGPGLVNFHAG